jgi:hypothetical protein
MATIELPEGMTLKDFEEFTNFVKKQRHTNYGEDNPKSRSSRHCYKNGGCNWWVTQHEIIIPNHPEAYCQLGHCSLWDLDCLNNALRGFTPDRWSPKKEKEEVKVNG